MGCLQATASLIQSCLSVRTERRGALNVEAARLDTLSGATERLHALAVAATRWYGLSAVSVGRKDALNVSVSLVCSTNDDYYLRVTPTETQWVTEWDSAIYDVQSNTQWEVN